MPTGEFIASLTTLCVWRQRREAQLQAAAEKRDTGIEKAQERDYEAYRQKRKKEMENNTSAAVQMKYGMTEAQAFPLAMESKLLEGSVVPKGRRALVVYIAPLYGAGKEPTTATTILDSMIRYTLRPAVSGPVALNLIPMTYITSPWLREDNEVHYRNLKPEEYLRDAQLIGADIFVYGRADKTEPNVLVQLAMSNLRTSATTQFSEVKPKAAVGEVVYGAASSVARFAGLDDAAIAAMGMSNAPESLPTAGILDASLNAADEELDTTSALALTSSTGGKCVWFRENVLGHMGGEPAVDYANDALRQFPDDPRLLLAKARALEQASALYAAYIHTCEFVRRQPDSLLAAASLRMSLRSILRRSEQSPLLPQGYRGAMRHISDLVDVYPDNWALRWDKATCMGNTVLRYMPLALADAYSTAPDKAKELDYEAISRAAQPEAVGLSQQTLAELRQALERRPDDPNMIEALLYWHDKLTDRQGEDAPEVTIKWQLPLLARVNILDPLKVEPDLIVAQRQSYGSAKRQLQILADTIQRTNRDPAVMRRVAWNLLWPLRRAMDWDMYDEQNQQKNAHLAAEAPQAALYIDCFKAAINGDAKIERSLTDMILWLDVGGHRDAKGLGGVIYNYRNTHYKAAQDENRKRTGNRHSSMPVR